MALFTEKLTEEIVSLIEGRASELRDAIEKDTLRKDMKLLISVANGEVTRTNVISARVENAIKRVLGLLLGNALQSGISLSDEFWKSDIGIVISRARWWISVDELITISNAAALAFGENSQPNRMRISRAIDKGLLEWVPDPSVANPMQNKRVLRDQVERLRDLRSLPE